jgi:ElaB/YqjD/DUF883 family membrane-anchored ribosome-binding protein
MSFQKVTRVLFLAVPFSAAGTVYAQQPFFAEVEPVFIGGFNFFSAIVTGIVIALSFGLMLSAISMAAGITIITPEEKIRPGNQKPDKEGKADKHDDRSLIEKGGSAVMKLNTAFGLWALITAVISLFFAGWFAGVISGTVSYFVGAIVGLTIWGLFFLTVTTLELKMLSGMLGALYRVSSSTVHGAGQGIRTILGKSDTDKAADMAETVTRAVREEIFSELDTKKLRKGLQTYIQQLRAPSAHEIKKEIASLLNETEFKAILGQEKPWSGTNTIIASLETHARGRKQASSAVKHIREAIELFKEERASGKDMVSSAIDSTLEATGKDRKGAEHIRQELEQYLRNTNKAELEPEAIKANIEKILKHPREGMAEMRDRIGVIDREMVITVLEQRGDMDHDRAEQIVGRVLGILGDVKSSVLGTEEAASSSVHEVMTGVENKLRNYLDSLDRSELDYDEIKDDIQLLFHDPGAGADALIKRFKAMDRNTIKAIIASRKDISEEDAEKMVQHVESVRDEAIGKAERMKEQIEHKLRQVQEDAAEVTEQTRRNAAAAAWWSVTAAAGSAVAAVLGGIIAAGM